MIMCMFQKLFRNAFNKYRDHSLKGKYYDFRECHIQPDWLLMYKLVVVDSSQYPMFQIGLPILNPFRIDNPTTFPTDP